MTQHFDYRTDTQSAKASDRQKSAKVVKRPRGRPRGYDEDAAIEAAMRTFWSAGYEGTSMDELCRVMNMPRASIYQAFGGKDALFFASIDHYNKTRGRRVGAALVPHGSLIDDLAEFYDALVALGTGDPGTPGCLVSSVLADAAVRNPEFQQALSQHYAGLENALAARLEAAGWSETARCDVRVAAGVAAAAARGIMARARTGESAQVLVPVGQAAARAVVSLAG